MAPIQPAQYPEHSESDEPGAKRSRKAMRYAAPVAVAGVAALTISLVPALADAGSPSLPSITAEQLLTKIAASDTQTVSGSVKITTNLGLPAIFSGSSAGNLFGGDPGGGGRGGRGGSGGGSAADPQAKLTQLLVGTHKLHVAADGPDRQKVSIIEPAAEYSLIHNGTQIWAYDSASNEAFHATAPQAPAGKAAAGDHKLPEGFPTTPQAAAREALKAADGTASVTVDGTARVAGHRAYELLIEPQHADTTTVGAIRIAVDSATGVPLKFTLTPKSGGKAVVDIGFTKVSFDKPAARTFAFTPPKGTKVTESGAKAHPGNRGDASQHLSKHADGARQMQRTNGSAAGPTVIGQGWDAIAVVKLPGGMTPGSLPDSGRRHGKNDAESLLNSFGSQVSGPFGSGTVFHTRLVNALLTDNGTLYVGAVTQSALTAAANSAAK